MGGDLLVLVAEDDEAIDPHACAELFTHDGSQIEILPDVNHLGVTGDSAPLAVMTQWLKSRSG